MSEETKQPTSEDLKEMRKRMHDFYKEELPTLRLQEEYERLQASIEESRLRRTMAIGKLAYIESQAAGIPDESNTTQQSTDPQPEPQAEQPRSPRKLADKKD